MPLLRIKLGEKGVLIVASTMEELEQKAKVKFGNSPWEIRTEDGCLVDDDEVLRILPENSLLHLHSLKEPNEVKIPWPSNFEGYPFPMSDILANPNGRSQREIDHERQRVVRRVMDNLISLSLEMGVGRPGESQIHNEARKLALTYPVLRDHKDLPVENNYAGLVKNLRRRMYNTSPAITNRGRKKRERVNGTADCIKLQKLVEEFQCKQETECETSGSPQESLSGNMGDFDKNMFHITGIHTVYNEPQYSAESYGNSTDADVKEDTQTTSSENMKEIRNHSQMMGHGLEADNDPQNVIDWHEEVPKGEQEKHEEEGQNCRDEVEWSEMMPETMKSPSPFHEQLAPDVVQKSMDYSILKTMMESLNKLVERRNHRNDDENDSFGHYVASELKQVQDQFSKQLAKLEIQKILFKAHMGILRSQNRPLSDTRDETF
uniref:uncharacterized protein isoform X1 n=2 Tax=Myxine glutinosa TaxID=7769 RepID=UPI00359028E4